MQPSPTHLALLLLGSTLRGLQLGRQLSMLPPACLQAAPQPLDLSEQGCT